MQEKDIRRVRKMRIEENQDIERGKHMIYHFCDGKRRY
jgi:hypothetical protein